MSPRGRGQSKGGRKIDTVVSEDGRSFSIRYLCDADPNAQFVTELDHKKVEAATVHELKERIQEYIRETEDLQWSPVIVVDVPDPDARWSGDEKPCPRYHRIQLSYKRLFQSSRVVTLRNRPKRHKYRRWDSRVETDGVVKYLKEENERALEGRPGSECYAEVDEAMDIILPYTPEAWSTLLSFTDMIRMLSDKINEFTGTEKRVVEFIKRIQVGSMRVLMEGSK